MRSHTLKTWPEYFSAVWAGRKRFEIRKNDFKVGDEVILQDYKDGSYTGYEWRGEITYVTDFEQKPGYVVFGMKEI